ncbi:MAG: AsmA-like C-terminal region-containing protein [candidate division NC10 bacterium]
MRRKLTIAAVILLILGALVAFAVLNLGRLVKSNKDYILAQAEQALGRKVAVEDIGVTVWGGIGIRLKNFALADDRAFSKKDALRAADLQVNVEFFPLLWKEVRVTRLILREPVIRVIRNKKGKLNFASLGPPRQEKAKKGAPSAGQPPPAAALPLLVSRIKVADGEIHYLDRKDGVDLRVRKIDLTVKGVGLDQPVSIKLAAAVNADHQNLKVEGKVGPLPPTLDVGAAPVEGEIEISSLNIDDLQRVLPQIKQRLPRGLGLSGPLQAKFRVSGSADALTLSGVELKAAVFGAERPNLRVTGRIGPLGKRLKDLSMKGDVTLRPVMLADLKRFAPLAGALPKDLSAKGPLSLTAHVDGTLEKLALTGKIDATASAIRFGNHFRKSKGVPLVISTDARVTKKKITLKKANITLHTMKLTGTGAITRGKTPALRLTLDSSRTDLAGWEKILPILQGYNLSGRLEAHTRINGRIKKGRIPDINGSLKFTGLRATMPQLPQPVTAKSATVTFTGQRASLAETPLRVGKSELRLSAQIERFAPLALTYRMSSPEIWLADVWKGTGSSKNPEVLRVVKDNGRVWEEKGSLAYRGQFSSAQGRIADIDYTQLQARVSMAGQVVTIESLQLRAYNGSLRGRGRYDMRKTPPQFTLGSQFRNMDLSQLFRSASATATKHVRGAVNLDVNLAGSGNQWQDIQRTLTGQGKAEVVKGALLDVNIAESALTGLTGVPGLSVFISPNTRKKYPTIFGTKNTEFDQLKGSVNIRGGKVHLDDLLITAADWAAVGKGWVTLDQRIDLKAQLVLSRQLSTDLIREVKLLKYLRDRQGRLLIPFRLAGTLPRATPQPDMDHVARLMQRGLLEQGIQEGLKQLFK